MTIQQSNNWNAQNLAHRFTVSFFKSQYGDSPRFVTAENARENQEMNYFNVVDPDNEINAMICAGLLVNYMEAQGIPYHPEKKRADCFRTVSSHLKIADGKVLYTADIVDHYFMFLGEDD